MGLLTIGAFAKASRLSPKALRLYDELGLLTPARVDPATGYRLYAPEQLEQARLVAWLRRLGMPLARIQHIHRMDAAAAAQEVRTFWAQVEADTASRRDLATFLIDHLSRKDPARPPTAKPLGIRYAALSDTGLARASNQDTAYAGPRLLAVADGCGSLGAPAGAAAIDALKPLETDSIPAGDLLNVLEDVIEQATQAVRDIAGNGTSPEDTGTTLTAMLWTGSQLALVHIGDSRVYLLRDKELFQITHDHTVVQSMIDDGRLSPDEAASHPQRSLLIRALGQGADTTPDIRLHDAQREDRYLLCSDGLSTIVPAQAIHRALAEITEPEEAVRELVHLANNSGGPDNISCVIADVIELQQ
ncbi:MerR family transcriptional regulator [Streptomyces sp. NPDC048448]|uniref:MerR family transcriptional regulator n=1 Tax=Streptomyces sp. NPDC048448 TaxID=3365554 RepID=UPI00371FF41C